MAITKKDVEHVARLARIALSEEEKEKIILQMVDEVINQAANLELDSEELNRLFSERIKEKKEQK